MHAGSHAASAPESNSSMPLHLHGTVPRSMMQPQQPQHWQQQQQHLLSNTPGLSAVPERQSCIGAGTMQQQTSFGASCAHATGRASVNRPGSMSRQAARSRRSSTVTGLEGMRGSDATGGADAIKLQSCIAANLYDMAVKAHCDRATHSLQLCYFTMCKRAPHLVFVSRLCCLSQCTQHIAWAA